MDEEKSKDRTREAKNVQYKTRIKASHFSRQKLLLPSEQIKYYPRSYSYWQKWKKKVYFTKSHKKNSEYFLKFLIVNYADFQKSNTLHFIIYGHVFSTNIVGFLNFF